MKHWKGVGTKEGNFGTMDDNGFVPDSEKCTEQEYDNWVASQPAPVHIETELDHLVEWAKTKGYIPKQVTK